MSATDSVAIFAEGSFSEQILELVTYLAGDVSEEEQAKYAQPFQEALTVSEGQTPIEQDEDKRRAVLTRVLNEVKGLGEGTEKDIEGFFNLLFAHFLTLFDLKSSDTRQHLDALLHTITSSSGSTSIKYRLLSNLFNSIPRRSALRLPVYTTLLEIASANDELDVLGLTKEDVDKWLLEWEISPEEKSRFLKLITDAYAKCENPQTSYEYSLAYIRSLPPSDSATRKATLDVIAAALRLPFLFDFDSLFRLDAVIAVKDEQLFSLLQIFMNEGLQQYQAWESSHPEVFAQYDLDKATLGRKIRLLSLATLGVQNIGRDLPYATIASEIQVDPSEVEKWVIDVIRTGLLSGKLSQTSQTLRITRATARAFGSEQWALLEKRLVGWKTGLASVLEVVAEARRKNAPVPQTPAPAPTAPTGAAAVESAPVQAAAA